MKDNKSMNSNIELILEKINGECVLVNKKDIESAIELKNKVNEEILANVENEMEKDEENSTVEFEVIDPVKEEEKEDNFAKFAKVLEISRDSLMGNSWINPIEYLAIIDQNSNEKLSSYISKVEEKTNKLYEDLTSIVVKKYKISDENKVDEISKMYQEHDKDINKYLDLVDDVIYNVEVDWNDFLLMDNKLNLFNSYTVEKKLNNSSENKFEEVIENVNIETNEFSEELADEEIEKVSPVSINLDSLKNSNLNFKDIVNENQEHVNTKELHSELETKNNDELNEYINNVVSQIEFVQNNIEEKISLYRTLTSEKYVEENNSNILNTLDRLSLNSKTAEDIMSKIMNSNDSNEIKDLLLERNDIYSTNVKIMKKISKHIDLDESLSSLNEEIISLKIALDNLSTKLSVAYNIAHKNYSHYSKEIEKQNAKLSKEAHKKLSKEQKMRLKELRKQQKKMSSKSLNSEDQKIMDEIIANYQSKNDVIYNVAKDLDLFADPYQMKQFRNKLSDRINEIAKIGRKLECSVDNKENLFNKYFILMNSELGIISELSELAGLLELKRIKLISEIAEKEIVYYKTANIDEKILFTTRANFAFLKILSAEILVLRTILLHREYLAFIKEKAKSQCFELASYIEWDHRLYWWNIATTEAVNSAFNNEVFSQDEGVQYLYNEMNKIESECNECDLDANVDNDSECCCGDCSCGIDNSCSSDEIPMPKVMVMKFERVIEKEKVIHKNTIKNIIQKQEAVSDAKKNDELVDETKKNKKLRKLNNRGMSKAGLRIQEIINETKDEVNEFEKEKNI